MNIIHDGEGGTPEQLSRVDLNLLVAFDALARERSVTRAAGRVGVTQSAMSHALRRLRELLGDPLLVRGQSGMVLTPRAEALVVPLRSGLLTLGRALVEQGEFEPATARRAFTLAMPDLLDNLTVPRLLARIRAQAPHVELSITQVFSPQLGQRLETGDVDIALVAQVDGSRTAPPAPTSPGLLRKVLIRDRFVCLLRAGHAALTGKRALSLARYTKLPHVLVTPRGDGGHGPVDEALAQRALQRHVVLRMPHFLAALSVVAQSELVLTAPTALAVLAGDDVVAVPAPLSLPEHSVSLCWHERFSNDAGHRWLRGLVTEVAHEIKAVLAAHPLSVHARRKK